jgi:predicted nucleic acid-binding protein
VNYLLDTTVVIDHVDGYAPAVELLERLFSETGDLYTCDVVTCESFSRGDAATLRAKRGLLNALEYVALSPDGAQWAGDRRRERVEAGLGKPSTTDALIAALANSLGATVVTRNAKDFAAFDVPVLGYGEPLSWN